MISSTCNQYSIRGIFLILLLMISTTFIQAQKADLSFSIHLKKANLKEFIFEIEKASGYSFIYGEEIILKHPITLSLRKAPLSLILQKAFAGQNISFKINKNHIILKKYALQSSKKSFTLNGYVLDSISKETLIGANIYDQKNRLIKSICYAEDDIEVTEYHYNDKNQVIREDIFDNQKNSKGHFEYSYS